MPYVCVYPFATSLALYLSTVSLTSYFIFEYPFATYDNFVLR